MDYEKLIELVKKRRTMRKFKPGRILDEDIDKIIEVARWAPSGFNSQPWDFVVVKKEGLRKKIVDILQDNMPNLAEEIRGSKSKSFEPSTVDKLLMKNPLKVSTFHNASAFIILYGDTRAKSGLPPGENTQLEGIFSSIFDASLANAFMYMHLAAASLGLAAQWWTAIRFPQVQAKVKSLLEIPEELVAFDMLVLGYPGAVSRPKLLRPKEKMIHIDDSGANDYRTTEEVKNFAKRTRAWTAGQHMREYR